MPEVVVPSYAVGCICIPGKPGFVPLLLCILIMCANNRVHYGPMVVFVCLHITLQHYHHYKGVFESIELLKCLDWINSLNYLSYNISKKLVHFSCDYFENTCTLSYYHQRVGHMNQMRLFRVRSSITRSRSSGCYQPIKNKAAPGPWDCSF